MNYKHNKGIVPLAKTLRKNMTKEEKHLWYDYLRECPIRFIRQKVIRISNLDINKNFEGVCIFIDNEVKQSLSQLR